MQKDSVSSHSLATYLSPVVGSQKGWYSERVPLKTHHHNSNNNNNNNTSRRHISASTFTPFYSGRTLPSKWEDAERWICSPVGNAKISSSSSYHHYQRRPKSKSGPLGPVSNLGSSSQYYLNLSPALMLDGGVKNNFMVAGSPFSTGVLGADRMALNFSDEGRPPVRGGVVAVGPSVSVPGWSDLVSEHSQQSSQDERFDGSKDGESVVSRVISRRDMATQISSEGSSHSSPKERLSFSSSPPSPISGVDQKDYTSESEVRDVQVDQRATVVRRSRRHGKRMSKKKLPHPQSLERNATEDQAPSWEISAADDSTLDREEAKITAWENLQKAKAEAALRELEVKLEKKKSASMDKILNKLRVAEMKAQEMRSSLSTDQGHASKTSHKKLSLSKSVRMAFFGGCFACHAP